MIGIINYGVGNIRSFETAYKLLGIPTIRISKPEEIKSATHIILPGVGHFDHAMKCFNASGLRHAIEDQVFLCNIPVLGICVGMQMLANSSEEGDLLGLGWISGNVRSFSCHTDLKDFPMPHMGWNTIKYRRSSVLSSSFESNPQFYFLHSYYFEAKNKHESIATANYGIDFDVAVRNKNIYGVQFHPEKSHHWGSQLLKNFAKII